MNTAIRVHRILAALENYQNAGQGDDWSSKSFGGHLGDLIGCYRNPDSQNDMVGIFVDGLAWFENSQAVNVRFDDIADVSLLNGKESEGLLLNLLDGKKLQLPVKGHRGRLFDSMEMLRFLDRVIQDLDKRK
jgi:hypothetical protein